MEDGDNNTPSKRAGFLKSAVGVGSGLVLGALVGVFVGLALGIGIAMALGIL